MEESVFNKLMMRFKVKQSKEYQKKYSLNQRIRFKNRWHALLVHANILDEIYFTETPVYKCLNEEIYKITYWHKNSQSIKDKFFEGENAYEKAVRWGKRTLTNFNHDLIQTVFS